MTERGRTTLRSTGNFGCKTDLGESLVWLHWPKRREEKSPRAGDPPESVTLSAIGYVRSEVRRPRPKGWDRVESTIDILERYEPHLLGLERFSHIIVVFYLDIASGAPVKPAQLALESGRTAGILATRSQLRPNHLGVSAVRLVEIRGHEVLVKGLDAVDGTPVLDLKPYLPSYDSRPDATVPD